VGVVLGVVVEGEGAGWLPTGEEEEVLE
jgi:hypothetical protein